MSYFEDKGFIEASLGGKMTAAEVAVFGQELVELIEGLEGRPYQMLLDYSRAKGMNAEAYYTLGEIRDKCHELGASKIVSVPNSAAELERETAFRLQMVLEGREEYVLDPSYARFAPVVISIAPIIARAA